MAHFIARRRVKKYEFWNLHRIARNEIKRFYFLVGLMPIDCLTTKSEEKLHKVPEHDKGEPNEKTKGASKICDEGFEGEHEVLSQDGGTQRPVDKDRAKLIEVP